jgi:hypothetical protein
MYIREKLRITDPGGWARAQYAKSGLRPLDNENAGRRSHGSVVPASSAPVDLARRTCGEPSSRLRDAISCDVTKKSESSKTRSVEKTFLVPLGLHPKSLFSTGALLLYDQRVWVVLD